MAIRFKLMPRKNPQDMAAPPKYYVQVELGNLCIFYPSLQSEGADTEDAFSTVSHIKRKGIRIIPKQSLSNQMSEVSVEKVGKNENNCARFLTGAFSMPII